MDAEESEDRIRLIREISEISVELASLTSPLASQFVAFVSKAGGGLGGISKKFSDPVTSLAPLNQSEIVSVNFETGKTQTHFVPIRSIKGGHYGYSGSLGVVLDDGTFLAGGGPDGEQGDHGNLVNFTILSNVKIKKISAGYDHFLILSESGRVFSMLAKGKSSKNVGQLGTGDTNDHFEPVEIMGIPKIVKIRAGYRASSFIDESGDLWVCGSGDGYFPFHNRYKEPTKIASNVRNVFSGFHSLTTFIQKTDGQVLAGGYNSYAQSGAGFTHVLLSNIKWARIKFDGKNPLEQSELKKISCSYCASFLLLADGTVFSCGEKNKNTLGRCIPKATFAKIKIFEKRGERVLDLACGWLISVFLTDSGRVYIADSSDISIWLKSHDRKKDVGETLRLFGKKLKKFGEIFWEVTWRNENDREKLKKKISEGAEFKISVWQGVYNQHIFITEKVGDGMTEKHRIFKKLKLRLNGKIRELASDFTKRLEKENEELNKTILKKDKEIAALRKEAPKIAAESAKVSEVLTLLRSFDVCLAPLNTVKELENFLCFFDFSGEQKEDEIFKFYKNTVVPREFESIEQRSAVGKIRDILKIYKVLKESPHTKKYFEFHSSEIKVKFESIDKVYRGFFEFLNLAKNSENAPNVFSPLDSVFRYFGISGFDPSPLILFVSSISDSLSGELQSLRQRLSEDLKNPPKKVPEIPTYPPISEDAFEKYLESFGDDATFFDKFSFLVLEVLSRFVASLSKELANQETQQLLGEAIRRASEHRWNELTSSESVPKINEEDDESSQAKLLESLRSVHSEMVKVYDKMSNVRKRREIDKYFKQLDSIQRDLQSSLVSFLVRRIREDEPSDDKIIQELLDVFKALGITEGIPTHEVIIEILEEDFDLRLGELREKLSAMPKESAISKEFAVIGFKNSEMKEEELFYDSTGSLKEKYTEIPRIKGFKGKPLKIFIKFYAKRRILVKDIQIKFVHLPSGESFGLNYPECESSALLELEELQEWGTFQITVADLRYSGEFALVVRLRSDSSERQMFFHRGIFNVFPQEATPED